LLGFTSILTEFIDCHNTKGTNGYKHGFVPSDSKTDNLKVTSEPIREIDTDFVDQSGNYIDGLAVTWTDPLRARNTKWSEWNPAVLAYHEAQSNPWSRVPTASLLTTRPDAPSQVSPSVIAASLPTVRQPYR
jgi:hypothetical protein